VTDPNDDTKCIFPDEAHDWPINFKIGNNGEQEACDQYMVASSNRLYCMNPSADKCNKK